MTCRIDHITVTAPTLESGGDLVFERLGVRPRPGGRHPRMGTHNLLLRLSESTFLEVIAIDPSADAPSRPRWFGLDALRPDSRPRLACWVVRTDDIRRSIESTPEALGVVEPMSRGDLTWRISIPEDGHLPLDGTAPALIQWDGRRHPALTMHDDGCSLVELELRHPNAARVDELLRLLDLDEPGVPVDVVEADAPGLSARIRTPHGLRLLA